MIFYGKKELLYVQGKYQDIKEFYNIEHHWY